MQVDKIQVYQVLGAIFVFKDFSVNDLERFTRRDQEDLERDPVSREAIKHVLANEASPYITKIEGNRYRLDESSERDLKRELRRIWESFSLEYRYKIGPSFLVALDCLVRKYDNTDNREYPLLMARAAMRGSSEKIKVHYWYTIALESMIKLREAQKINSRKELKTAKQELVRALRHLEKYRGANNSIDLLNRFTL